MKALVTGSTGFLGSHLCRGLLAKGWEVRAFHRPESSLELLQGFELEHAIGDITQPKSLASAMRGVQVVFHAAALLSGGTELSPWHQITVKGTRNVLDAALKAGVERVVHTSSVAALGVPSLPTRHGLPHELMNETHTWNYPASRWAYGCSKYLAELQVQKAVASGLDAVIVNPTHVLGAGDRNRRGNSVINLVTRHRIPISIDGGLNAVHIEDVVQGHLAALEKGQRGERYILGGENITHADLMTRIAFVADVPPPRITLPGKPIRMLAGLLSRLPFRNLPVDPQQFYLAGYYFYYDTTKSKRVLGMGKPQSVSIAIREAYDWFCRTS